MSTGCPTTHRGPHIVRSSRQMSDNRNCLSLRVQATCGHVRHQGKRCLFSSETYHSPVKPGTEYRWQNNLNSLLPHPPCVHFNIYFYMIPAPFWGEHSQRPMNSTISFQLHLAFCSETCTRSFHKSNTLVRFLVYVRHCAQSGNETDKSTELAFWWEGIKPNKT